jgi:glycosyltransferase involved in cell wall biosynthesis
MTSSEYFPLVSIITPTKNRSSLLRETIASVIAQNYLNWEMLIIDDHSTDNTFEMLKEFSSEKRILYHQRNGESGGAQVCRNQGVELAKGEYIILLDSDDLLSKKCVENRVEVMNVNSDLGFAAFPTIIFGWEFPNYDTYWNLPTKEDDIVRFLNWDPIWQTGSVIWRKKSLQLILPFNIKTHSFQDIEIHIKAIVSGLNYRFFMSDADNFHREHEGERIGHNTNGIIHLYSHEELLRSIYNELTKHKMLTEMRGISLAGFYFRVCVFWIKQNNLKRALQLWKNVSENNLTTKITYSTAIAYFYYRAFNVNEDIPALSRLQFLFYKLLPPSFFIHNNTWKKLKTT